MLLLSMAHAASVSPGADLQSVLNAAADGEVITMAAGDYSGDLVLVGKAVTLEGEGAVLSGSIWAPNGEHLTLRGLTIRDGAPAIYSYGGILTLNDVTLSFNGSDAVWGGAITAVNADTYIVDSTFERNEGYGGGHIAVSGGQLRIDGSRLESGLAATTGGAINADGVALELYDNTFATNSALTYGGAINLYNSIATVENNTFTDNDVEDFGGAIAAIDATMAARDNTFQDNSSYDGYGGALYVVRSTVTVEGGAFYDNLGTYAYGAALWGQDAADVTLTDVLFEGNEAYRSGGAIGWYYAYGPLTIDGCTFVGNRSLYGHGGAIWNHVWGELTIRDTVFDSNRATYNGGAVYSYYYSTTVLERVDLTNNRSDLYSGGGAYFQTLLGEGGGAWLTDVRVEGNEAALEGGGVFSRYLETFSVTDSSFVGNHGEPGLYGGGLYAQLHNNQRVHDVLFLGNHATYGGAFYEDQTTGESRWTNTVIQENAAVLGGGGCVANATSALHHVNWLGNNATDGGSGLCLYAATVDVRNSVFAWNAGSPTIETFDDDSALLSGFNYLNTWENLDGDSGGTLTALGTGLVQQDPLLGSVSLDGVEGDSPVPSPGSPLIDAGDPTVLDPDGSISDIGAHAGPDAPWADNDGDGHWTLTDCDDDDATVNPSATDTPYDGINSDCGANSDYDADGDGFDSVDFDGSDCDDGDDAVVDCPEDTVPTPEPGESGGCSTVPAGGWMLAFLALLLRR